MRRWLLFLPKPLFEEADGHLAHGATVPRCLGFHFTVKVVGNLKGCFHEASLLYCRVKGKGEGFCKVRRLPFSRSLRKLNWTKTIWHWEKSQLTIDDFRLLILI
jgi:hypothetical protein